MSLRPFWALTALFLCCGALILLLVTPGPEQSAPDTAAYSDIAGSLGEAWDTLDAQALPGRQYRIDYTVLNADGAVVAATRSGLSQSVFDAVRRRETVLDIRSHDAVVGSVLFYDPQADTARALRAGFLRAGALVLLLGACLCAGTALWMRHALTRPFARMRAFARRVAAGDLDVPLAMDRGNLFGPFTESFDLMRSELARARENERRADLSKKELVASLSHDIKTPVASIQAVAELMALREPDAQARANWQIVLAKSQQIGLLVGNLFHASLEELQRLPFAVAEESSETLLPMLRAADAQGRARIAPIPPCLLCFDRLRLSQVFDNIVSNSYKYADTEIDISFRLVDGTLEAAFSDSGPGVPPETLPLLCHKYFRGENAAGKSGSGLGLYLARDFMERMNGTLHCENRLQNNTPNGFTVRTLIPLAGRGTPRGEAVRTLV